MRCVGSQPHGRLLFSGSGWPDGHIRKRSFFWTFPAEPCLSGFCFDRKELLSAAVSQLPFAGDGCNQKRKNGKRVQQDLLRNSALCVPGNRFPAAVLRNQPTGFRKHAAANGDQTYFVLYDFLSNSFVKSIFKSCSARPGAEFGKSAHRFRAYASFHQLHFFGLVPKGLSAEERRLFTE